MLLLSLYLICSENDRHHLFPATKRMDKNSGVKDAHIPVDRSCFAAFRGRRRHEKVGKSNIVLLVERLIPSTEQETRFLFTNLFEAFGRKHRHCLVKPIWETPCQKTSFLL